MNTSSVGQDQEAFFWEFLQTLNSIKRCLGEIAPDYNLTVAQAMTLCQLREDSARSMSLIAKHIGCDPSVITDYADRLVKAGYVSRTESPEDRRTKLLALTSKGQRVRRSLIEHAAAAGLPGLALLDAKERADLLGRLQQATATDQTVA